MRPSFILQLMIQSRDGDWGWQTDTRSHNSGYKNRDLCWLIVMSEYHHLTPGNSIIMQHSCLGHYCIAAACRTEDTLVYFLYRMLVTTGCAPGGWPPLTGCLGVGARVWCIRVLPSPAWPALGTVWRPGPGPSLFILSRPVECHPSRRIERTHTSGTITQVSEKDGAFLGEYLPTFCISVFY